VQDYRIYRVVDTDSGMEIADNVRLAKSFRERLLGLMGMKKLESGSGLWLNPCNGIHTFGMRFPIDVVVLDRGNAVMALVTGLKPNRVLLPIRAGHSTLELPAGSIKGIRLPATLAFEPFAAKS